MNNQEEVVRDLGKVLRHELNSSDNKLESICQDKLYLTTLEKSLAELGPKISIDDFIIEFIHSIYKSNGFQLKKNITDEYKELKPFPLYSPTLVFLTSQNGNFTKYNLEVLRNSKDEFKKQQSGVYHYVNDSCIEDSEYISLSNEKTLVILLYNPLGMNVILDFDKEQQGFNFIYVSPKPSHSEFLKFLSENCTRQCLSYISELLKYRQTFIYPLKPPVKSEFSTREEAIPKAIKTESRQYIQPSECSSFTNTVTPHTNPLSIGSGDLHPDFNAHIPKPLFGDRYNDDLYSLSHDDSSNKFNGMIPGKDHPIFSNPPLAPRFTPAPETCLPPLSVPRGARFDPILPDVFPQPLNNRMNNPSLLPRNNQPRGFPFHSGDPTNDEFLPPHNDC